MEVEMPQLQAQPVTERPAESEVDDKYKKLHEL
jgi:hypothetical protein